jgi:hypothetical protein
MDGINASESILIVVAVSLALLYICEWTERRKWKN